MEIQTRASQRIGIVIEQNKSGTWSVAAYLFKADGKLKRRLLGVFDTYGDAADSLEGAWSKASL